MATVETELQDLGRLPEIDVQRLDSVLWGRFGVVDDGRTYDRTFVLSIEDLDHQLGDAQGHRLELHLIEAKPAERARLRLAAAVRSRVQPRVYAIAESGRHFVIISEPAVGTPFTDALTVPSDDGAEPKLKPPTLSIMAAELATLLARLHDVNVHGVRFRPQHLRVEDGHWSLDGFSHLLGATTSPEQDVEALADFLIGYGDESFNAQILPIPTTATLLRERIRSSSEGNADYETELPTDLPFVGRVQALAALEGGISQAQIAKPTAIIVEGERGVGKSRLLREFVSAHLETNDILALTGAWQNQSGETRSGLLGALEQLPRVLPRLSPDERDSIRRRINRATKHLGAIVARSAPALGSVLRHAEELPQLELGGDFSRHTAVIADVLKSIGTRQRPLLLVLDNIESIDANSAAILEIITQSRPAHYTLLVMGLRTDVEQSQALANIDSEHIRLTSLTAREAGEILTRSLPGEIENTDAIAQVLWSVSGGIPLALGATLRSWLERGRLSRGLDGVWRARKSLREEIHEEPSVREAFSSRLSSASHSTQEFALLIAILGMEIQTDILNDLHANADEAIKDLCERGLLARTNIGVRFPHDTIREIVIDSASDSARRTAHQSIAALLTKRQAPVPHIVYHRDLSFDVENSTPEDFDKLSRLHVEAGRDRLNVYDLERARWHLERALEHSHDPEQREIAAEGLADVCLLQDDLDSGVALYTALIATAQPSKAVRVGGKAVQFLFSKNANADARQLGLMALEVANEPTPLSPFGKLLLILSSIIRIWLGIPPRKIPAELREALCRLYPYMMFIGLIDDPISVPMYVARSSWIAKGLRTGSASIVLSLEASLWTVLGRVDAADRIFVEGAEIARAANDAWAEGMVFHHWGGALLALDRYSEGQDRLDDAIAAFRETGDVSISLVSMFYKCCYGRDREHADVILGWADEALTTARRNGKVSGIPSVQSVRLHVLARQGRTDLEDQLIAQAKVVDNDEMSGIDRFVSRIHLAFACLESSNWKLATEQLRAAQAQAGELGGAVPEFCHEVHLVTALILLAQPTRTRADRKLLRYATRKFRGATKRAPRLRVLGDLLELKLALDAGDNSKSREFASKIVSSFSTHGNLHAARQAHRTLAQLLKGDNVLASAEHEKIARNLGVRLGLSENVLLSDFSDISAEVGMLALSQDSSFKLEESNVGIPAAGMLTSAVDKTPKTPKQSSTAIEDQSDVLEAWALTSDTVSRVSLASIIDPVRAIVGNSIDEENLTITCPDPELKVSIESGDLQILLINLLLACRDAIGTALKISTRIEEIEVNESPDMMEPLTLPAGRYLSIEVLAQGEGNRVPVLGSFATCENLVQGLGGDLKASTSLAKINLHAHIPLTRATENPQEPTFSTFVIHPSPSIREGICNALDQINVAWHAVSPERLDIDTLDQANTIFSDVKTAKHLRILQPLWSGRLIEIEKRGIENVGREHDTLRIPVDVAEIRALLRRH